MKWIPSAIFAAFLLVVTSVSHAQDEQIAATGMFLNDNQIEQVMAGHEFTGESKDSKQRTYTWVEEYRDDSTIYSVAGRYSSGGTYEIKNGMLCIRYSKSDWEDWDGCYKIRIIDPNGSVIEYVKDGKVQRGTQVD